MNFSEVQEDADMAEVTIALAEDIRAYLADLYEQQHQRNVETNGAMANVVLAAITIAWMESVHGAWNTMHGESAMSLLKVLRPRAKEDRRNLRRAARDFLRRSGLWIRGTK